MSRMAPLHSASDVGPFMSPALTKYTNARMLGSPFTLRTMGPHRVVRGRPHYRRNGGSTAHHRDRDLRDGCARASSRRRANWSARAVSSGGCHEVARAALIGDETVRRDLRFAGQLRSAEAASANSRRAPNNLADPCASPSFNSGTPLHPPSIGGSGHQSGGRWIRVSNAIARSVAAGSSVIRLAKSISGSAIGFGWTQV